MRTHLALVKTEKQSRNLSEIFLRKRRTKQRETDFRTVSNITECVNIY
jgi:hypothetical protein